MIIGVGNKKFYLSIIIAMITLFAFSYFYLKETISYSLACAVAPAPMYCLLDEINVLRKNKQYNLTRSKLLFLFGINLLLMFGCVGFCLYFFLKENLVYTIVGTCIYVITYVTLWALAAHK